jgi:soluble lytic murein transglycosylase
MERNRRKKSRGHGCLGFGIVFSIAVIAIICVLLFSTNALDGLKYKVLSIFYQQHYTAEVEAAAKEFNVDDDLIYAVIHTESGFREDVESHAGAIGLMQLMPDTFTWLQEKLDGEVIYTADDLKTPAVNIRYGSYYLAYLTELFGDSSAAIAAYNAGAANVDKWLADPAYSSDGKTLSDIPYKETREYVDKVMRAWEIYKKIYEK